MKKTLTFFIAALIFTHLVAQQNTIAGWTFSTDSAELAILADSGLTENVGIYEIRAEAESTGNQQAITMTNGANGTGDYAATATGWDNGANDKFWSVEFIADGYSDFRISSKMRSGGNTPGPKFWKLQYKLDGGAWADIPGGDYTIANNWTTGVVENLAIPSDINNPGATSIFLRWIMTSNEDINGVDVLSDGICKIDDILVTALNYNDVEEVLLDSRMNVYPNPSNGLIFIEAKDKVEWMKLINMQGQTVMDVRPKSFQSSIDLSNFSNGVYFVQIKRVKDNKLISRKIILDK